WIAAAITAIIVVVQTLWEKCKGFRVFIFTAWEAIKRIFELAGGLLGALWNKIAGVVGKAIAVLANVGKRILDGFRNILIRIREYVANIWAWVSGIAASIAAKLATVCAPLVEAFRTAIDKIKGFFGTAITWIHSKFEGVVGWIIDAYNKAAEVFGWEEIKARGRAAADESWASDHPEVQPVDAGAGVQDTAQTTTAKADPIAGGINGIGGTADKSDRIKNINISIDKLIDNFTIQTTNMQESKERIKALVSEALLSAVNDVNLAI
ncbi:MAG: hypothetical protein ACI4TV_00940, partial [Paludibacteraceae bacterium]